MTERARSGRYFREVMNWFGRTFAPPSGLRRWCDIRGRALLNVPMGLRYPDGEVLWQVASCFPLVDVRGVRYHVTSVVESPELRLIEEVAGWLRQDLVQSMLGVAFSLQAQLNESPEIEVIEDRVRWAVGVLQDSASRALGLVDLTAPRLRPRLDESADVRR